MIKRIVCLANSRKTGDRCIAGRELLEGNYVGPWIRPVSARADEAITLPEMRYENSSYPRLLDIISISFLGPRGRLHQTENWLLDPNASWSAPQRLRYEDLHLFTDPPGPLWANGHSTAYNVNDYVLAEEANNFNSSLKLIAVDALQLSVFTTGAGFGNPKRRVQAIFSFNGEDYRLWATDSEIEDTYRPKSDGTYDFGPCYLAISLANPWNGCCYKVVAGIIGSVT